MAEINMPQRNGKKKKQTPRIDFTPMVDLGFLLITFFIYTTTIARPNAMVINMPVEGPPGKIPEESTITIIPVKGHNLVYYEGNLNGGEHLKHCSVNDIRTVLLNKKNQVKALPASFSKAAHKVYVLIKPNDDSQYGDMVQLLDEMNITDIDNYMLLSVTPEEKALLEK
jgi:biopolymer transport protein ExbD